MAFPHSHKTVVVLDHSPYFTKSSQQFVYFDIFTKNRAQGFIPLAPVAKTLWTCNAEAAVEFCRIVYDLFPTNKLIQLISSDTKSHVINNWSPPEQTLTQLMTSLAKHGPPESVAGDTGDCSVMHGLNKAIEALCQPSETQQQLRAAEGENGSVVNNGRIICLTAIKSDNYAKLLEDCVQDALAEHNKLAQYTDNLMPITHCELVLVHIVPISQESNISHRPLREVSPILASEVHVSQSGRHIAVKMVELVVKHFTLASTTVTGIPMKEEQNASSSANYDVELLHSNEAHLDFFSSGQVDGLLIPSKEELSTNTVTLKWCTPKANAIGELQQCTSVHRITPVDVNSRPSSCLTNFLLNGRSVMLEQPRKSGVRIISHILASHGGEIFIHTMSTARSILEDPPSISEGPGGRVTGYRINDFGELMKTARIAPVSDVAQSTETPIEREKGKLERMTRQWPMVINDTIIFNMLSQLGVLPSLIIKESLTEDEVLECKKVILDVVRLESKNEPLPVPPSGSRGKGPKREEQYRQMWSELERYVRAHVNNSSDHLRVLDCLLDCKKPAEDARPSSSSPRKPAADKVKEEKVEPEADRALQEYERYQKLTEREKQEINKPDVKTSPDSPTTVTKRPRLAWDLSAKTATGTPPSLLSLWTTRINTLHKQKCPEFAGRQNNTNNKAELYTQLKENSLANQTEASSTNTAAQKK